jgi:hypothetical protein
MKMRHSAVPVDPKDKTAAIPQDDRLHIKVAVDDDTEKVFLGAQGKPCSSQ